MKAILTQKQLPMKFYTNQYGSYEQCRCPFCNTFVIGKYEGDWLTPVDRCYHFIGFAQGYNEPTAMFKGVLSDESR